MKNHKLSRQDFRVREMPPKVEATAKGVLIQCPFCDPPHVILPGMEGACGTTLRVTAVQTILTAHAARFNKIICMKCHKGEGEMVKYRNGWVHLEDCMPGTRFLAEPPRMTKKAALVMKLPPRMRKFVEKHTGTAQEIQEIDGEGNMTGKILGYCFVKGSPT